MSYLIGCNVARRELGLRRGRRADRGCRQGRRGAAGTGRRCAPAWPCRRCSGRRRSACRRGCGAWRWPVCAAPCLSHK